MGGYTSLVLRQPRLMRSVSRQKREVPHDAFVAFAWREPSLIRFTTEDGNPVVVAETKGYGIYLDNDSLIDLATGDASRQKRFVDALHAKATLLFSWANAIEVAGPQGASAEAVRGFLDRIGPHWIPLQLNPWEVVKREQAGLAAEAAVSTKFMEAYFQRRAYDVGESSAVIDLTREAFFQLGAVVDWVHEHRDKIRADAEAIDNELRALLEKRRADYEKNPASLDEFLPPCRFDERFPATFVLVHLQRILIKEAKEYHFKRHDGLDLCHATIAAAYGSVITLDKEWKRRVEALPAPHNLARTYYRPEINQLVATLEALSVP